MLFKGLDTVLFSSLVTVGIPMLAFRLVYAKDQNAFGSASIFFFRFCSASKCCSFSVCTLKIFIFFFCYEVGSNTRLIKKTQDFSRQPQFKPNIFQSSNYVELIHRLIPLMISSVTRFRIDFTQKLNVYNVLKFLFI